MRSDLPGPPRSLSQPEIPRILPNGRELAGFTVSDSVSAETHSGLEGISAELSLASKFRFPETETVVGRDAV